MRYLSGRLKIELEFGDVGFWGEGKTGVPGEKPLGARTRTNNKLNPHMTPGPGVEPGPHWWEASALTTAPSLLPARTSRKLKDLGARQALRWRLPYKPHDRDPDERAHVSAEEETKRARRKHILYTCRPSFPGCSGFHAANAMLHWVSSSSLLTLSRQRFFLRKTHFLPLKGFFKCYVAKCH